MLAGRQAWVNFPPHTVGRWIVRQGETEGLVPARLGDSRVRVVRIAVLE